MLLLSLGCLMAVAPAQGKATCQVWPVCDPPAEERGDAEGDAAEEGGDAEVMLLRRRRRRRMKKRSEMEMGRQLRKERVSGWEIHFINICSPLFHVILAPCLIEEKTDYLGNDIGKAKSVPSKEECAKVAAKVEKAKFWTYQPSSKTCWYKTSKAGKKSKETVVSGNVECGQ